MKKFTSVFCLSLLLSGSIQAAKTKAIYGLDDRQEVASYPNKYIQKLAKSVAGSVSEFHLHESAVEGYSDFSKTGLGDRINACPGERFSEQPSLMSCTGFLVGTDLLVTAGHCMKTSDDCQFNKWVFGFTSDKSLIYNKDIYGCKKVVARGEMTLPIIGTTDYAIVQLDRKVKDREPLKFRTSGRIKNGSDVLVIGHPMGLPMKIADNATVKGSFGKTFRTNLDTYGGNSGSPIINSKTGLVEGILVQGDRDYSYGETCTASNYSTGHGEVVYKITRLKALQKLFEDGKL